MSREELLALGAPVMGSWGDDGEPKWNPSLSQRHLGESKVARPDQCPFLISDIDSVANILVRLGRSHLVDSHSSTPCTSTY